MQSELAFKRGNRGFILWTGFLDNENSESKNISHYLIYLEKRDVVAGYFIFDGSEYESPDSSVNWFSAHNKTLNYSEIWEESSSDGKKIFEDIYGKPKNKFTNSFKIAYFYVVSNKKRKIALTANGQDVVSAVFNISKNKKGNWINMNSFCWSLSNLDLKELCYEKMNN